MTIFDENSQFLTILGREEERKAQILTILESGLPENVQILSILAVLTPDDWTGELAFSFENGEIDVIGTKSSIFDEKGVNFCASNRQFLSFYRQFLSTVYNRYNIDIIKYNTEFDKSDEENQSLRNQINVLLEKNQNNQGEAYASSCSLKNSNVWIEENEEGNVTEDDNKLQMGYSVLGEFDWYTKRELEQFAQEKLKDPVINTVYRLIKDKFEDGSQITGKEFIEYLKEVLDELFVTEVPHPETGELVEASIDTIVGEDWDEERLTDDEKERYEEIFKLIELKRFCRYEHQRIFPYFQHEGRTVFVNYTERPYQSPEERYEEFQRLHSLYEHSFTDEQIELMDFEKHEILVERFNEQFPENEKHMVNDMVRAMQDNMVDIGLFKIGNYEYNSYSVLNGFDGMIRIRYSEDCLTGIRMPFKTIYEQQEEIESERRAKDLKLLKSNASMVYSDKLDYSELLEKFKPARIKLTPEGKIPAKPSLSEAFKYLGFVDGKVLEEWEMNQICDTLLKKYNRSGSGVSNFSNILSVSEYNTYNNRYTLKGVASENVTENDTTDNEEEKPYIPLPRERRNRVRR